jgi:hypothetical protein
MTRGSRRLAGGTRAAPVGLAADPAELNRQLEQEVEVGAQLVHQFMTGGARRPTG